MQTAPIKSWFKCVVVMATKLVATSDIQFHIKYRCFCSCAHLFILNLPLQVSVSHFIPACIPSTGWETSKIVKTSPSLDCLVSFSAPLLDICLFPFLFQLCPHPCYHIQQLADIVAQDAVGVEDLCHAMGVYNVSLPTCLKKTLCFIVYPRCSEKQR